MKQIIFLIALVVSIHSYSQDPHFSQYLSSPLTLNPALTGSFDGLYRITGNYRQQWWSVGSPFNTGTVSFEHQIFKNKIGDNDRFAIGGLLLLDESLGGGLKSTYASISTAYHIALDAQGRNRFGAGFQTTYGNRRINESKLTFANQFTSGGFNTALPSGELSLNNLKPFTDINTGIVYVHQDVNNFYQMSASVYHLTQPRQTTLNDDNSRIPRRFSLQAVGDFKLNQSGNRFMISGLFMVQGGATEFNIGGAFGYNLSNEASTRFIYGGVFYRLKDAVYPYVSYKTASLQVSLSYDAVVSSLNQVTPKTGSLELSVIYINHKK